VDEHLKKSYVSEGDIYNGWMMQETPRKYTNPTYTKNNLRGDPRLDGKRM
jgi:hypothetical protein